MFDSENPTTGTTTRPGLRRRVATAALGLATGLAVVSAAPASADASTIAGTCVATSPTTSELARAFRSSSSRYPPA